MPRVTKAQLESRIASMYAFQQCELRVVSPEAQEELNYSAHFVPVCQYGAGQVPLPTEIGRIKSMRLLSEPLKMLEG